MLSKLIYIIAISSFLAACGAAPDTEDDQLVSNASSSKIVIGKSSSSTAQISVSSTAMMSASSMANSKSSNAMQSASASAMANSSASLMANSSKSAMMSSSKSSRSKSSSSRSSIATQSVTIEWGHPTEREDGSFLTLDEIGGYEIRTKAASASFYTRYEISGNRTTSYALDAYTAGMTVEIAVYDTKGIYSQFVTVN